MNVDADTAAARQFIIFFARHTGQKILPCRMQKIENCPVCLKTLVDAGDKMACIDCDILVDPVSGEISRIKPKKAIIKNIIGKLKSLLWL